MGTSVLVAAIALATVGQSINPVIKPADVKTQNEVFQQLWGTDFSWTFADLPEKGGVEDFRVPYSGYIYPDKEGGTIEAMRKYDRAYHRGLTLAASYEKKDTSSYKEVPEITGPFGAKFRFGWSRTPNWHGHCNGWSAAAIRHAEPQRSVYRNGIEFDTADIKALLAEMYIYNDTAMLTGEGTNINPGELHAILGNWLGRGSHPIGIESDPGAEKWNYPVYAYASASAKRSNNRVEVKTNIAYAMDSDGEFYESPRIKRVKYFHYILHLNDAGQIKGGYFLKDSTIIDMIWVPLSPKQGGARGNERGNPHLDVNTVLSIWRESVDKKTRGKWYTIDPSPLDRIAQNNEVARADVPLVDDDDVTAATKLNAPEIRAPVFAKRDRRRAPMPVETSIYVANVDDATNDGPTTEAWSDEADENDDVAPVVVPFVVVPFVVHVGDDAPPLAIGIEATLGN